ncbi:MAG TPA: CDP-diacylglycerol--serine O-phosphatidyltransferase [Bacteroidales bacterium]|nr:CDP-diacylglycerol--serine O-phosphatidyltransferase [Bacteroidales bacterium]
MIRKQIPNTITLLNLLCGIMAIYTLYTTESLIIPSVLVILGAVFDFMDGMAARALKAYSELGKELDSLADAVTFGVAPSLITVDLLQEFAILNPFLSKYPFLVFIPLFMALMSAYRLAKFNIDSRQTMGFIGVPTPANALIWISLPIIYYLETNSIHLWGIGSQAFYTNLTAVLLSPIVILFGSILMSFLLVAELNLFALKFKNFRWKDNKEKFVFLITALLLIFAFNLYSIPLIIIVYIIESLIINKIKK